MTPSSIQRQIKSTMCSDVLSNNCGRALLASAYWVGVHGTPKGNLAALAIRESSSELQLLGHPQRALARSHPVLLTMRSVHGMAYFVTCNVDLNVVIYSSK